MRTGLGLAIGLAAASVLGCTPTPVACTEIGASSGVNVTVSSELVAPSPRLGLEVCFGGRCRTVPVQLSPGSISVPQDCPTDAAPDTTCSATVVPDGTLVGFAEVADLPVGPIEVGATLAREGQLRTYEPITVEAETTYPNGRDCPAGGNQAAVRVTSRGLLG